MTLPGRQTWLIALVIFLAAFGGVVLGRALHEGPAEPQRALHELLHRQLGLDDAQRTRIEGLEARYSIRRRALEMELRSDNARLADAIETEHGYGPRVSAAIERSHQAMGDLQKETLAHIFAMRSVLRPDQARKFDRTVVEALTADAK